MRKTGKILLCLLTTAILICSLAATTVSAAQKTKITLDNIPAYTDSPYVEINNNKPQFTKSQITKSCFEKYSDLDKLGRCGVAFANIGIDTMPTEERESIGMIKPSGWHTIKYDCVDGKYLYNRCHLIGYQLAAENANEKNLITGTRYLNVEGMLPFENKVADYVEETDNHVLYRVTPVFEGKNLVASGVQIEAYSVEDKGKGICFNVYCYNVQPGVIIDYSDGSSRLADTKNPSSITISYKKYALDVGKSKTLTVTVSPDTAKTKITWSSSNSKVATVNSKGKVTAVAAGTATITAKTSNGLTAQCVVTVKKNGSTSDTPTSCAFVVNTNTKKFHKPTCSSVKDIKDKNRLDTDKSCDELIAEGYSPCKKCHPEK